MKKQNHLVNLSLQVVPINTENTYEIIDAAIETIQQAKIKHEVQPFSTIMEGNFDELLELVKNAKAACLNAGAEELLLNIQIHLKKDADVRFEDKTDKFKQG